MLKEVTPVFQVVNQGQMISANPLISLVSDILYKDSISYETSWTGTPTGTFEVQGSNSYNPGLPQSGGGYNAGIWTDLPFPGLTQPAGASGQILFNMNQVCFRWLRLSYTSTALAAQTVALVADVAGSLNSTYFLLNSGNNAHLYYVWFDDGGGVDPMIAGRTGVQVTYTDDDTAATLGASMATAIAALGGSAVFTATGTSTVTITNLVAGPMTPAVDGSVPTGFTFTATTGAGLLNAYIAGKSLG